MVCRRCGSGWSMPVARVLALIGGLALVAAYAMPWFGVSMGGQGIVLSGQFLGRFLSGATDLRQFMPGAAGGPAEVRMLLLLVYLFPVAGLIAAALALLPWRRPVDGALVLLGLVPLVALAVGLGRLPPGARPELGLWAIGVGAAAVLVGGLLDLFAPAVKQP
ncbi:MAG TPA: hypothetical protein VGL23_21110 [Chloroflexota bacterium]